MNAKGKVYGVEESAWEFLGIKWQKPVGKLGVLTFKWPAVAVLVGGGFVLGALIF